MRRFAEEKAIMLRRLRFAQGRVGERWEQAGRFRKRHPNDCGNPKCGVCHSERRGRPLPTKTEAIRDQVSDV